MKNIAAVFVAVFLACMIGNAQQIIIMKDHSRISAEVVDANEYSLVLTEGSISLSLVHSVQFLDSMVVQQKITVVNFLLSKNIIVYLNDTKLIYTPEPGVPSNGTITQQKTESTEEEEVEEYKEGINWLYIGLGLGPDYGGLGARLTFIPQPNVAFFVSGGYIFKGLGYNIGMIARIAPQKKIVPTFIGMYGYNGVIIVEGASHLDKVYYGPSFGGGIECKSGRNNKNFMHFQLIIPIRPQFDEDIKRIMNNPSIEIQEPPPFLISAGYHFGAH